MFGLPSFGKIMVLLAVLGAVWYGFKMVGRLQKLRDEQQRRNSAGSRGSGASARTGAGGGDSPLELVQCPACKAYIPAGSDCTCGGRG